MEFMTTFVTKTCVQLSSLRQPLTDIVKKCPFGKKGFNVLSVTFTQCHFYHVTPILCKKGKQQRVYKVYVVKPKTPPVTVWAKMTVLELATVMNRKVSDVLQALTFADAKQYYNENSVIETISITVQTVRQLGSTPKVIPAPHQATETHKEVPDAKPRPPPEEHVLRKRCPVVTIMGHVDHGKTTLLDALRNTSVVDTEFGGITQHIGAFNVKLKTGEKITFLDTPGHAAFDSMRARGVQATDIVVLVVAADDGVMPQTLESIQLAKNANVPIVVAINKIDRPNADILRTQKALAQNDVLVEELGGDIQCVHISALKRMNLNSVVEAVAVQAEMMNLRGDPSGLVEGIVIESCNDPRRGKLATILVQRGTLQKGNILVSGVAWAKVRAMFDHAGNVIREVNLSEAAQVIGWRDMPEIGNLILEVETEKRAHEVIKIREEKERKALSMEHHKAAVKKHEEHLIVYKEQQEKRRAKGRYAKTVTERVKLSQIDYSDRLNIIVKGDVAGSVEAILDVIDGYDENEKCPLNVIHYGIGHVTENDIKLAESFAAIIYRFNVNTPRNIEEEAKTKGIAIKNHKVIYKLIDDLKEELEKRMPIIDMEEIIGEADVLQKFVITEGNRKINVAGCCCTTGVLKKSLSFRVVRGSEIIYTGGLVSMKHLKQEVASVKTNVECGLSFSDHKLEFKPGDKVICFRQYREAQKIQWNTGF